MPKSKNAIKQEASKNKTDKPAGKMSPNLARTKSKKTDELPQEKYHCTFCCKPASLTQVLIAGPPPNNPFICEACIEVCVSVLLQEIPTDWTRRLFRLIGEQKNAKVIPLGKKRPIARKPRKANA
jgi:hypothetical protein